MIIMINGEFGSGKTSAAKALQHMDVLLNVEMNSADGSINKHRSVWKHSRQMYLKPVFTRIIWRRMK
ncbi:hypothetical protein [Paenibacillus amylolyticus]|uniref:hypothetical protein n=1 Tax=Paenibacillus amylolyticus TaxID=1451 RepID=UPI003EB73636